jgi:hypothetical protein
VDGEAYGALDLADKDVVYAILDRADRAPSR